MEIQLTGISEIFIRTQSNQYTFRATRPGSSGGFLSGGVLGDQPRRAFLAGRILPNGLRVSDSQLTPGDRAVFVVTDARLTRLTTSVITRIAFSASPSPAIQLKIGSAARLCRRRLARSK